MTVENQDDWNPRDPKILENQRDAYDKMRHKCPVAHSQFLGWSLFRHEDVAAVLADPDTYSNKSQFLAIPNGMNPPIHHQYRDALDALFDENQLSRLEPLTREVANSLIEPMINAGEVEFVREFSSPFAMRTLCTVLGWPEQQWQCLSGWAHDSQLNALDRFPGAGKDLAELFSDHVKANLKMHRDSPKHATATAALLTTEINGVPLDDEQIVSILRNWTAGHGTMAAALSIIVMHLAQNPELQTRLRNHPSLIPTAIEEILRIDDPLVTNTRTTTREVEIRGRKILKGDHLSLMWISANRDANAFDNPETINIERSTANSLVWGQGIHICQGASMAKLEIRVALEQLLLSTKHIECANEVPRRDRYPSNGLAALPIRVR